MNQLVMDWIAALRSGEYRQTKGVLYKNGCYCATGILGLLCGMKPLDESGGGMVYEQDGRRIKRNSYLPAVVMNAIPTRVRVRIVPNVERRNDRGDTFVQIADYIEDQARAD